MKTLIWIATLFLLPTAFAQTPTAPVELIVTGESVTPPEDYAKINGSGLIIRQEPVFGEKEQKLLRELEQEHIARSSKVTVGSPEKAEQLQKWIRSQGLRLKVEPSSLTFTMGDVKPVDRFMNLQWGLRNNGQIETVAVDDLTTLAIKGIPGEDVGIDRAPPENMSSQRITIVAVLDTGVAYEHPDLQGQLVEKPDECKAFVAYANCDKEKGDAAKKTCRAKYENIDSDGNGYPMDCSGWNTTSPVKVGDDVWGSGLAADESGHGTHVAGTIAAAANSMGVRGVAQNVRILPVKVLSAPPSSPVRPQATGGSTEGSTEGSTGVSPVAQTTPAASKQSIGFGDLVARGVLYAIKSNAKILNLSLGWPSEVESHLMRQMLDLAKKEGVLVVAAAGNDSTDALVRPCLYSGVICVASHDPDGSLSNFSNYGSGVDIAAPGLNILSTWPESIGTSAFTQAVGYEIMSGTSMAAPHVSGVLARLLNAGMPEQEAYARLLAGTRPQRRSSLRTDSAAPMSTLAGNVDLALALSAKPQPLFLPADKAPIGILWNGAAREVPIAMPFKNIWQGASNVTVEARLVGRNSEARDAILLTTHWTLSQWNRDETKALTSVLRILNPRLDSELMVELTFHAPGQKAQVRQLQAEVRTILDPAPANSDFRVLPIRGANVKGAAIRTVTSLDEKSGQDYVAIQRSGNDAFVSLLRDNGSEYQAMANAKISIGKDELLLLHRVDLDLNGRSEYVFIYRTMISPPSGSSDKPQRGFKFYIFDENLNPLEIDDRGNRTSVIAFDNKRSAIAETFQWMRLGQRLVPAWVARGLTPDLEKAKFDPWNPEPADAPTYRLYYLSPEGLRSVQAPGKYSLMLARMSMTSRHRREGRIPVLYGVGKESKIRYFKAEVIDGRLESETPISENTYRNLRGVDVKELTSLDLRSSLTGTAFVSESFRGAQRVTMILDAPNEGGFAEPTTDAVVRALSPTDTVTTVAGVFAGSRRRAVMAQTIYDLQFHDLVTDETASTSLRRFSFLPGFFFFRLLFPAALTDSRGGAERLPALFLSSGLGLTQGVEVIAPRYEGNRLVSLVRPAKLRFQAQGGCEDISNAIPANEAEPTQLMFFCGDRFVRVPLAY